MHVHPGDSIKSIKTQIKEHLGILVNLQNLFYGKIEMLNDKKLQDYSVPDGSTLNLFQNNLYYTQVFLKPAIGRPIAIEVSPLSTIKDVKEEIYELRGIPPCQQQIIKHDATITDNDWAIEKIGAWRT